MAQPSSSTTDRPAETTSEPPADRRPGSDLDDRAQLGQMIVARFAGTRPSASLLRRIERGEVGGVILFRDNVTTGAASSRRLVRQLQAAARRGSNPALLIATDQEGGSVRRFPGAPVPDAAEMGSSSSARAQGRAAGLVLRRVGANVDLAPVADVSSGARSFLGPRAFGTSDSVVAARACHFASGLRTAGVGSTLKHFPGLGTATTNTDFDRTVIPISRARMRSDLGAYRRCGARSMTLVMVSSAVYPRALGPLPAVLTAATYRRELPAAGVRDPVTISDDLETPSVLAHARPSRRAVVAGLDLLLYARTETASAAAYPALLADVRAGRISRSRIREASGRIARLKAQLAAGR